MLKAAFFVGGIIIMTANRIFLGVGINDADYMLTESKRINGKKILIWACPFYKLWTGILRRCYYSKFQEKCPTYIGCSIAPEWVKFSQFKLWMESKNWEGMEIDKDLLMPGNKVYGPSVCIFIDQALNKFLTDHRGARGAWPIGTHYSEGNKKFIAQCSNPFTGDRGYLGSFDCANAAHSAWRARKHEYALRYADMQQDPRVALALRIRYLPTPTMEMSS